MGDEVIKQLYSSESQKSFVVWVLSQSIVLLSSIVIIGYALDTANILNFPRLSIAIILVILAMLIYFLKFKPRFERKEIIQSLLIFIAFFFIGIKPILFSLYPINHSVDFVHHYTLLNYIYEHQALVNDFQGNLGEMYRYPFGIDLIQAYLSWVTGIDTLRIGHIFLSIVFALSALAFYGILSKMFSNNENGNIVALCSPFLLLILSDYSLNEYWEHYHSSQMFGTLIVLVSILILSEIKNSKFFEITLAAISITLLLAFPLWIAILNFFVISYLVLSKRIKGSRISRIAYFIIPQIVVFIVFFFDGYVTSSIGISTINGDTTKFNTSTFGGYILIFLFAIGVVLFLKKIKFKELNSIQLIFSLASIGVIIQFVAFKYLAGIGIGSEYMVDKTFFLAKYFYIAFIAYSIFEVLKYIKVNKYTKKTQYLVVSCLFLIIFILSLIFSISETNYLINQGEYKLSSEVENTEIKNDIILFPYPKSPITSYLIYIGMWEQDRLLNPMSENYLLNKNIPNIKGWISGSGIEEYALIGDIKKQLVEPNLLKDVTIIKSNGNSAIVKRNPGQIKFSKIDGILNGSFENVDTNWIKVKYKDTNFEGNIDSNKQYYGSESMSIKGSSINGGISQNIKLERNTLYKITAWSSGKNITKEKGFGAFMTIEGSSEYIVEWSQSDFDWQKKELIFDSKNLSEINLVLGLGAYGSSSGQVWFDKIELYKEDVTH